MELSIQNENHFFTSATPCFYHTAFLFLMKLSDEEQRDTGGKEILVVADPKKFVMFIYEIGERKNKIWIVEKLLLIANLGSLV